MIVADASVVFDALTGDAAARQALSEAQAFAPHLLDLEILNALRRHVRAGLLTDASALACLSTLRELGFTRYPICGLTERIWKLRENITSYDAAYVAVAEALECPLVTTDQRLAGAPGIGCEVRFVTA